MGNVVNSKKKYEVGMIFFFEFYEKSGTSQSRVSRVSRVSKGVKGVKMRGDLFSYKRFYVTIVSI